MGAYRNGTTTLIPDGWKGSMRHAHDKVCIKCWKSHTYKESHCEDCNIPLMWDEPAIYPPDES